MENFLKTKIGNQVSLINFIDNNFKKSFRTNINVLDVKKNENIKKLFENINKKKYDYLTINLEKTKKTTVFKIFYNFLLISFAINRNTLIFYKIDSEIRGNNIFPVWPSSYKELTFLKSLYIWIKKFALIFFYFRKIELILIRIK